MLRIDVHIRIDDSSQIVMLQTPQLDEC